jgi:hypothetical protein
MGTSTDAILAFGVDLGEEVPKWVWDFAGVKQSGDDDGMSELDLGEELEKAGLTIIFHCSCDCPMYVLAAHGSEIRAWRGSPQAVRHNSKREAKWLKAWGKLPKKAEAPRWILFSNWC